MGIMIAQSALQSLVDEHTGISYKEALREIRYYIEEVKSNNPKHLKDEIDAILKEFDSGRCKDRDDVWAMLCDAIKILQKLSDIMPIYSKW